MGIIALLMGSGRGRLMSIVLLGVFGSLYIAIKLMTLRLSSARESMDRLSSVLTRIAVDDKIYRLSNAERRNLLKQWMCDE